MYKASFGQGGGAGAGGSYSTLSLPNLPWEFQKFPENMQGQMRRPDLFGPSYVKSEPWGVRVREGETIPESLVEATMNGYGQMLLPEELQTAVGDLGIAIPDEYQLSPLEYYHMQEYPQGAPKGYLGALRYPVSMPRSVDYGDLNLTTEETKGWFTRNWKWLAIGAGGLLALGIVVKIVL
jgi:hypothetical protein